MSNAIQYIVYAKETPKQCTGLLGDLDIHVIHLFLVGGEHGIVEHTSHKDPVGFYTDFLKEQDMVVKSARLETTKSYKRVYIEIDAKETPLAEYTQWKDCDPKDKDVLAWKTFWITCHKGTTTECLGLGAVASTKALFQGKQPLYLQTLFNTILSG